MHLIQDAGIERKIRSSKIAFLVTAKMPFFLLLTFSFELHDFLRSILWVMCLLWWRTILNTIVFLEFIEGGKTVFHLRMSPGY